MSDWYAIFDWDGVIVDSSRQHEAAWECLARKEQRSIPPGVFLRSFGMKNENVIPELLEWTQDVAEIQRLSLRKEALFRELIREAALEPLPGVVTFLERLKASQIPCAIASSTPSENIRCVIDKLGVRPFFQATVCGEDVKHGKPNPEVFLLAASKLRAPPARCVVFEDAHVGIQAARKAGMRVVGVATTHPGTSLDADRVVQQLDELQPADLAAWFA